MAAPRREPRPQLEANGFLGTGQAFEAQFTAVVSSPHDARSGRGRGIKSASPGWQGPRAALREQQLNAPSTRGQLRLTPPPAVRVCREPCGEPHPRQGLQLLRRPAMDLRRTSTSAPTASASGRPTRTQAGSLIGARARPAHTRAASTALQDEAPDPPGSGRRGELSSRSRPDEMSDTRKGASSPTWLQESGRSWPLCRVEDWRSGRLVAGSALTSHLGRRGGAATSTSPPQATLSPRAAARKSSRTLPPIQEAGTAVRGARGRHLATTPPPAGAARRSSQRDLTTRGRVVSGCSPDSPEHRVPGAGLGLDSRSLPARRAAPSTSGYEEKARPSAAASATPGGPAGSARSPPRAAPSRSATQRGQA